jgi:hypothetical protein
MINGSDSIEILSLISKQGNMLAEDLNEIETEATKNLILSS